MTRRRCLINPGNYTGHLEVRGLVTVARALTAHWQAVGAAVRLIVRIAAERVSKDSDFDR